ncbi:MAG: hypothetical protein IPL23_23435 [Saprospiraceae bacterium]|nr:hypothetical protein [Saprospiraceae bacterium]
MLEKEFYILLDKIRDLVKNYSFRVDNHLYSPEAFGNFYISFTNDELTSRLVNDRGEYFMEVLVDKDKWLLLTDFVEQKHHGSTFNLDLKLHKLYVTDSSLATNIKLLPKFLLLANSNDK